MNNKDMIDEILITSGADPKRCMKCGKCSGACPAYDEMEYHPHQFASMVTNGDIKPLLESESFNKCLTCYACSERCPRGVSPSRIIEAVRLLKIRQQGENHLTANDIPDLLDDKLPQQAIVSAMRKYSR